MPAAGNSLILPFSPVPPVAYFQAAALGYHLVFDGNENYVKQTIRNRYHILGANGVLPLTMNVKGQKGEKISTKNIEIDYEKRWVHIHLRAIESAYRSSPFFEHYFPVVENLLTTEFLTIGDFFLHSFPLWKKALKMEISWETSSRFIENSDLKDLRESLKNPDHFPSEFTSSPYLQVFGDRFPFKPNLSILDLLFNEGPAASAVLKR